MRHFFAATVMTMALFAGTAQAQMSLGNKGEKTPLDLKYEREDADRKENERAYNDQMKRLKGQGPAATSSDPWKGVRSSTDANAKR
jgi:hypothetical protein